MKFAPHAGMTVLVAALVAAASLAPALAAPAAAAEPPSVVFTVERPAAAWNNAQPEATVFAAPSFETGPGEGGSLVGFVVGSSQDGYRSAEFIAPAGEVLHVGTYTGVGTVFDSPDAPRMEVDYLCREAPMRGFTIHEIAWSGDVVASLAMDYWCDAAPVVWYQVRFNSSYPVASLAAAPARAAFARTLAGASSVLPITVTGVGPGTVHPGISIVEGDAAADIAVVDDGCAGTTLEPGATCTVNLRFTPADGPQVDRTARLRVPLDSLAGYRAIELDAPVTRPTSITLSSDRNPATVGNPVTVTAVITPQPPGDAPVTWVVDGIPGARPGGTTYQTTASGEHAISARFMGVEGYAASESGTITQTTYLTSSIRWTVYPSFSAPEGVVDLFAYVQTANHAFPPGGTLTVTDETTGIVLGQADGSSEHQLSISLTRVSLPGLHLLRADYSGVAPWILPAEAPILVEGTPSTDPARVAQLFAGGFAALARTGTPGILTVEALDARSSLASHYRGTVHVASSDPAADLPPDHAFSAEDAGTWRFPVVLRTLGEQTVTITDVDTGSLVALGRVVVGPAFTPDEVQPVDLAVGSEHACAIAADGVVECWGSTADQRLGFHGTSAYDAPGPVGDMQAAAVDVAVGERHACAALADGSAWCWGANEHGQAPRSDGYAWNRPQPVAGVDDAVGVSAGTGHACALAGGGTVTCWGSLQGGPGVPATLVPGLTGATAIASGAWHACALLGDGTVRCWGSNWKGQLGDGSHADAAAPVPVTDLSGAVSITADGNATCAVVSNGTVRCWGENTGGRLGDGTKTDRPGSVAVAGIDDAVSVTLGAFHGCARLADATIRCWGDNAVGQLGDGTTTARPTPVAAGVRDTIAVDAGGRNTCALVAMGIRCWGDGEAGMLGSSTFSTLAPVAPAGLPAGSRPAEHGTCALVPDGTVRCWGQGWAGQLGDGTVRDGSPVPVTVTGIDDAVALASNGATACVARADGTVWCWGGNLRGILGSSLGSSSTVPVQVPDIASAVDVDTGSSHACAILADATVTCWGDNAHGQLGNGARSYDPMPPVAVTGLTGAVQLALSEYASCARLDAGALACWGESGSLQLGRAVDGDTTLPAPVDGITTAVDVSASGRTACAALADGSIRCWGYAEAWQLGNGSQDWQRLPVGVVGVDDAVDVVVGIEHACAISGNGTLRCWGRNGYGELGDGTTLTRRTPIVVPGIAAARLAAELSTCVQTVVGDVLCWGIGSRMGSGHWPYATNPAAVAWRTTPRLAVTLESPAVAGTLKVPVILTVVGGSTRIAGWYVDDVELSPGAFWWDPENPQAATFTLDPGDDDRELHGFVRDARGGWSPTAVSRTRIDTTPPDSAGSLPGVTRVRDVPITVSGDDEGTGITGWLVSEIPLTPAASDERWTDAKPTTVTLHGEDGTRRVFVWTRDGAGNVSVPAAPKTVLDTLPPFGGGAPVVTLRASATESTAPVRVTWAPSADLQAGKVRYQLSVLGPGATGYVPVALADATANSVSLSLRPGTYRYRVRPVDAAGNVGPWHVAAAAVKISLVQETSSSVVYTGRFTRSAVTGASGGSVRATAVAGRSAAIKVTGRGISFVTTLGPARGKAQVWLDGRKVATLDLYAATRQAGRIAWSRTWGATETHRVRIVVTGTRRAASTSSRVDIDAFVVLR